MKNFLVTPRKFYPLEGTHTDSCCPNDRIYFVDDDGHVHVFKHLGRLIDIDPGTYEEWSP